MANLIGFDNNRENLSFKGYSKLSINFLSNYLYIEPENEAFKLILASFKWDYVMKKNILFIFADHNFLDFCLVFKNEKICKKTFDCIASTKKNTDSSEKDLSVDRSFINPLFQTISNNPQLNSDLIESVATWHQRLDEDDNEKYSKLMKEFDIFDVIFAADVLHQNKLNNFTTFAKINRKIKFTEMKNLKMESTSSANTAVKYKIIPSSQFQLINVKYSAYKKLIIFTSEERKAFHEFKSKHDCDVFKCVSCQQTAVIEIVEKSKFYVKVEDIKHACKTISKIPETYQKVKLSVKPEYEVLENCRLKAKIILLIFDAVDRTQCDEYFWNRKNSTFYCCCCCSRKQLSKTDRAKAYLYNEGTSNEFVGMVFTDHACKKRKYQPERYQPVYEYVLKPYFEIQKFSFNGKEGQKLIIFDCNDRSKCYIYNDYRRCNAFRCRECIKKGKIVSARLHKNSEGEEYVILSNTKHVCHIRTEIPKITLRSPEFEFMEETKTGHPKLFLFLTNERISCYVFYKNFDSHYFCVGCHNTNRRNSKDKKALRKIVSGKLLQCDQNGEYSFEMKPNQIHSCEPKLYKPEEYRVIPKTFDFFYYRLSTKPQSLNVAIKHPKNSTLCYTFFYQKSIDKFTCILCKKLKKYAMFKLLQDAEKNEYFEHDLKRHACEPINVSFISTPKFVLLENSGFVKKPKKPTPKIEIDESRVVKMPNFEVLPNKFGDPDKKLRIFYPIDRELCYEYYFLGYRNSFKCNRCAKLKICVTAKFHKDEQSDEIFVVKGQNEHVCEPKKVVSNSSLNSVNPNKSGTTRKRKIKIDESKIVRMPNFVLGPNKDDVPDKQLIIFYPADKTLCFEYYLREQGHIFFCRKCQSKKLNVSAKLHTDDLNGETFILTGKNEHICEPQKYPLQPKIEGRIVRMPKFELQSNKDGIPDRKLIVFHPNDNDLCYQYYFNISGKVFQCGKCQHMNTCVTAKLVKDESQTHIVLGKNEHLCIPKKYHGM